MITLGHINHNIIRHRTTITVIRSLQRLLSPTRRIRPSIHENSILKRSRLYRVTSTHRQHHSNVKIGNLLRTGSINVKQLSNRSHPTITILSRHTISRRTLTQHGLRSRTTRYTASPHGPFVVSELVSVEKTKLAPHIVAPYPYQVRGDTDSDEPTHDNSNEPLPTSTESRTEAYRDYIFAYTTTTDSP